MGAAVMSRADRRRAEREGRQLTTPEPALKPAPPKPPPPNAVIAIPAWREVWVPLVKNIVLIAQRSVYPGPSYEFFFKYNDSLLPRSRNMIASDFLVERPDVDVLVMIDTDIGFKLEALDDLVDLAREKRGVAGGCVAIRAEETWMNVRTLPGQPIDVGPGCMPQEVRYVGAAFMAIHRDVLEKLKEEMENVGFDHPRWGFFNMMDKQYKTRGLEDLSEDFAFCERAREAGFTVWALTQHQLEHHGLYAYRISPKEGYVQD